MKKLFIIQTNYIPWKGYFDAFNSVDEVILYDTMQYTKNDWRNRNQIKTPNGLQWLTIPIDVKNKLYQRIDEAKVSAMHTDWHEKHWKALQINYSKAAHFNTYKELFSGIYAGCKEESHLSKINFRFINLINQILAIKTPMRWSSEFNLGEKGRNEKLIELCKQTNSTDYYSGPAAKNYIDEGLFEKEGIKVHWLDYTNYPAYTQLYGEFVHTVSILDLIFNEGPNAPKFMKSFNFNTNTYHREFKF